MERFDHHCPVLGTCIAARNMRWFAGFLLYAGVRLRLCFLPVFFPPNG